MQTAMPLACFLSMIRPPGVMFENSLLQIAPVDKAKCPFVRDHNDIEFRLYTRHNPTTYQELYIEDDERLFASNIDYHAPTVIYFHAFMENPDDGSAIMIREAYMLRGDTNVIMVDASRLEAGPWYFTAAQNTWYIGRFAAQFIDYLVTRGLTLNNTHLIGHSLGAQAAGVAGSALKTGRVARITGLDPALPLFHGLPPEQRLDESDADFVDVIHTDGGIFGVNRPVGHADFYPNGGISPQPGCELEAVIPQQMLLNKCDKIGTPIGLLTFYLTPNKVTKNSMILERRLQKFFTKIELLKTELEDRKGQFHVKENAGKKEISSRNVDIETEDQIMVESTKNHYFLKPEHVNLETGDYNTGTMRPIVNIRKKTKDIKNGADLLKILTTKMRNTKILHTEPINSFPNDKQRNHQEIPFAEHISTLYDETASKTIQKTDKSQYLTHETQTKLPNNHRPQYSEVLMPVSTKDKDKFPSLAGNSPKDSAKKSPRSSTIPSNESQSTSADESSSISAKASPSILANKYLNIPADIISQSTSKDESSSILADESPSASSDKSPSISPEASPSISANKHPSIPADTSPSTSKDESSRNSADETPSTSSDESPSISSDKSPSTPTAESKQRALQYKNHIIKRQKRFLNPFKKTEEDQDQNLFFKLLEFVFKHRNAIPIYTVMREINTFVKSGQGELNHVSKEKNNYIGAPPPIVPVTYTLELGNENKAVAFMKRLFGLPIKSDRLTINGSRK